jgi:hypothetical protein
MRTLERLVRSARETATERGHDLPRFRHYAPGKAWAQCRRCGAQVTVNPAPPPNGIDVMGRAVAVNCGDGPDARHREG